MATPSVFDDLVPVRVKRQTKPQQRPATPVASAEPLLKCAWCGYKTTASCLDDSMGWPACPVCGGN